MDIMVTLGICFLVVLVVAPMLFIGRRNDSPETAEGQGDGPVIPLPGHSPIFDRNDAETADEDLAETEDGETGIH